MVELDLRDDAHNIFPLPLWTFLPRKALSSRRAQQRACFLRHVTISLNNCISGLNLLHRSYAQEAASPVYYSLPPLVATNTNKSARAFYPVFVSAAQRRALDFILHRTLELHGRLSDGNSTASLLNHLHTSDTFQYQNSSVDNPPLPKVA